VGISGTKLRRIGLGAAILPAALLLCSPLEARPRCPSGQIYRPSMGICQSKRAKDAQRYARKAAVPQATGSIAAAPAAKEAPPAQPAEPLSNIPLLEPRSQGSLNPLPPWKSGV
jgi:hypothetical protein